MKTTEYLSIWKEREAEEARRRDLAIKRAKAVANILRKKYKAKDVILFGSLIWRPKFLWQGTDIDLLVTGLEDAKYFEILADVAEAAHPFHLDLIPCEKAWPAVKERAQKEGMKLV